MAKRKVYIGKETGRFVSADYAKRYPKKVKSSLVTVVVPHNKKKGKKKKK